MTFISFITQEEEKNLFDSNIYAIFEILKLQNTSKMRLIMLHIFLKNQKDC